jgi:hypothetical protein
MKSISKLLMSLNSVSVTVTFTNTLPHLFLFPLLFFTNIVLLQTIMAQTRLASNTTDSENLSSLLLSLLYTFISTESSAFLFFRTLLPPHDDLLQNFREGLNHFMSNESGVDIREKAIQVIQHAMLSKVMAIAQENLFFHEALPSIPDIYKLLASNDPQHLAGMLSGKGGIQGLVDAAAHIPGGWQHSQLSDPPYHTQGPDSQQEVTKYTNI